MFLQTIALAFLIIYLLLMWNDNSKGKGGIPGPLRIPPFGNIIQIGLSPNTVHVALANMAKTYGDVMSIKLGTMETIMFSSFEAMKTVFSKPETYARDLEHGSLFERNLKQDKIGIFFSDGPEWVETRAFLKNVLTNYGYGNREAMKDSLLTELTEFFKLMDDDVIANPEGRVKFSSDYFNKPFINIMTTWMLGKRFSYTDPLFQDIVRHMADFSKNGAIGSGLITAFPIFKYILPGPLGYSAQLKALKGLQTVARNCLDEHKKGDYKGNPQGFADDFLIKMDERPKKNRSIFTEDSFVVIFEDILQAGGETTSFVLNGIMLRLSSNAKMQERVYQEILSVVGNNRYPSLDDAFLMPYTQAVILEGLRWSRVTVFGAPRKATEDFIYRNYVIKKGTILTYNGQAILFDEEFWGDPGVFRPGRFISTDGKLDAVKKDRVNTSFGAGKRVCFGEVLARDGLFIFFTTLVQKFKFELPPGSNPPFEPAVGQILYTLPYEALVTFRERQP